MKTACIEKELSNVKQQEELIESVLSQKEQALTDKALEQIKAYMSAQDVDNEDRMFMARTKYYTYVDAIAIVTGKSESDINNALLDKAREGEETYIGLIEGEEVCRGSYDYCLHKVGSCNEDGWYLPEWKDCGIIRA